MSKKIVLIISIILNLIFLSLFIFYEKEDKRYISTLREKDNISMLKIVGEDTEVINEVPQTGSWFMSYTCDDENAQLYWNEKKRTVVAKNISATECTLIFRENTSVFSLVSMYVNGDYVTKLDENKTYKIESYNCSNGEELSWDTKTNTLNITPILENTSCDVNFVETKYLTLVEQIKQDNIPQSDAGISFRSTSAQDGTKGLYYTSDLTKTENSVTVYYYRGEVENNYVVFGNYCWRIVRTVEDGSVRLRYGGAATHNGEIYTCPQTGTAVNIGTSVYYNDYMNKNYVNYKTSIIKGVIENWYRVNIQYKSDGVTENTNLIDLVLDSTYCNDMSEPTTNYFGAYNRLYTNKSPQYKCPSSTYGYTVAKGDLTYPVALLTADEVAYAGNVNNTANTNNYLKTAENYFTMTPFRYYSTHAYLWYVGTTGELSSNTEKTSYAVVPVISVVQEALIERGTGLYNDPYVIYVE